MGLSGRRAACKRHAHNDRHRRRREGRVRPSAVRSAYTHFTMMSVGRKNYHAWISESVQKFKNSRGIVAIRDPRRRPPDAHHDITCESVAGLLAGPDERTIDGTWVGPFRLETIEVSVNFCFLCLDSLLCQRIAAPELLSLLR